MNKKIWNFYKNSEDGKRIISLFDFYSENNKNTLDNILDSVYEIGKKWGCDSDSEYVFNQIFFQEAYLDELKLIKDNFVFKDYEKLIDEFACVESYYDAETDKFTFNNRIAYIAKDDYRKKACDIQIISWILALNYKIYYPILNPNRFDIFQKNCFLLGIELPEIPHTKDYREYCLYYYDICDAIKDFAEENNLTQAEICACIYDFAQLFSDDEAGTELPEPTNVWFTGAKGDEQFNLLNEIINRNELSYNGNWACNERTRRGDLVVMYCTAPRSYIHSIWRADSNGFFNPFTYYQKFTRVCNGVKVPEISFKELKEDVFFSQVPIVRKRLQGLNGVEITAEQYERLLELFKKKGGNMKRIPKLFSCKSVDFGELKIEKDVEEKVLIPFLKNIGYKESDWTRQLSLKVGRKEKAIPDFVFFSSGEKHFETAPFVVEVKYDFSSMIEFQRAFAQGFSYAKMLQSDILGLCDKERLLIFKINENRSFDISNPVFENHWKTIYSNSIVGAKLKQIVGAEVIKKYI